MWENVIGRSRPFCAWLLPRLEASLPGALAGVDADGLYRGLNTVQPSLIRTDADETTYNLHIILRFELELALTEGSLGVDDLPDAWDAGMERLLGVTPPGPAEGVLQDVHWGAGLLGYFPTYTIGNLMACAAVGAPERRRAGRRRAARSAASSRPSGSGCASTSTATAASSRRASCCAA